MNKEDIKIGAWIIWDGDTYPHPRQVLREQKDGWIVNIRSNSITPYKESQNTIYPYQLKLARLCREDEIPVEYKKILTYEIY